MSLVAIQVCEVWGHTMVDLRTPIGTSSPRVCLRGSRAALIASYRLAASLSAADKEMVVVIAAALSSEGIAYQGSGTNDFELAAECCLAGLYLKSVLRTPVMVALTHPLEPQLAGKMISAPGRLSLAYVRAISSTEVEYCLSLSPLDVPHGKIPQEVYDFGPESTYRSTGDSQELPMKVTLWAVKKGQEAEAERLCTSDLPRPRAKLMEVIRGEAGVQIGGLESDLLGLDEWRFREGLRGAFSAASRN